MDMENKVRQIRELVEAKREKFARVSDEVWAVPELYFHETNRCHSHQGSKGRGL